MALLRSTDKGSQIRAGNNNAQGIHMEPEEEVNWRNQAESTCLSGVSGSLLQWPLATFDHEFCGRAKINVMVMAIT